MQLTCTKEFPNEEVIILTDREKLYAVLFNLVKNVLKYTRSGSIDFGYVSKNSNEILFYVKDTGIGIPPGRLAAVFERFIQADITNKMAQQGAGLAGDREKAIQAGCNEYVSKPINVSLLKDILFNHFGER